MAPIVELEHLVDALKGFKRPIREGRLALENIIVVGIRSRTDKEVVVESLCLRTTKINEPPVKITVKIDRKTEVVEEKIKEISCLCTAGACKEHSCKHAMAVLIYLERTDESQLETLTCTDVEQMWGELRERTLAKFDPVPLREFCHVKKPPSPYKRPILPVTKEMEEEFRAMFLDCQPDSEAAVFISGVRAPPLNPAPQSNSDSDTLKEVLKYMFDNPHYILKRTAELTQQLLSSCTDEEKKYYEDHVAVTADQGINLCVSTIDQESDLWDELRCNRFTGTRIYHAYTYMSNKKPDWNKRFKSLFDSEFSGNADTVRGLTYESDSRDCYTAEFCKGDVQMVKCGVIIHPLLPWAGYSADGLVCVKGRVMKVFETKCPRSGVTKPAREAAKHVSYIKDCKLKERHTYHGQVQLGMLLTNSASCDFTIFSPKGGDNHVTPVAINDKFLFDMMEKTAECYFKKLLPWLVQRSKDNNNV